MTTENMTITELSAAKTITETCEKHGVTFEKRDFYGRGYYGICTECAREADEARMQADKVKFAQQEADRRNEFRNKRVNVSGLPARFIKKTFSDYVATTPEQVSALSVAKEYAENRNDLGNGRGMIITGTVGVGKTHIAAAIINEIIKPDNSTTAIYTTARDMIRHIRSAWRNPELDELEVIEHYSEASMLIIDEVGVQFGSDSELVQLFEVIDKRYGEQLPTVMISNLRIEELSALLGDRIIDRMREDNGVAIQLDWASNRGAA